MRIRQHIFGLLAMMPLTVQSQALYTFDQLDIDEPLVGQDGWRQGTGGSGSPTVILDGTTQAISGNFKTAVRQSDSNFDFASECDTDAIRITFDIHYAVGNGNVSIQVYLYEDINGDFVFNTGEGVLGFGLARNSTTIPTLQLQLVGAPPINGDVASLISTNDRVTIQADISQDLDGLLQVDLFLLNRTQPNPEWQLIVSGTTLPESTTKRISEVDSIQVRFDSGSAKIDNIEIRSLPTEPTPCEIADTNGDGMTNPQDFTFWLGCFNLGLGFPGCDTADQNQDGVLSPSDFTTWISNFNSCSG